MVPYTPFPIKVSHKKKQKKINSLPNCLELLKWNFAQNKLMKPIDSVINNLLKNLIDFATRETSHESIYFR